MTSSKEHNSRRRLKSRTLLTIMLGNTGAVLPPARTLLSKESTALSCSDTPVRVSVPLGPAAQGYNSRAEVGSGCQCCTGVTLTGTLLTESEKWGQQPFSVFFKDSPMLHQPQAGIAAKHQQKQQQVFWGIQKRKRKQARITLCPHWKTQI